MTYTINGYNLEVDDQCAFFVSPQDTFFIVEWNISRIV